MREHASRILLDASLFLSGEDGGGDDGDGSDEGDDNGISVTVCVVLVHGITHAYILVVVIFISGFAG